MRKPPHHPQIPSRLGKNLQRHVQVRIRQAGGDASAEAAGAALLAAVGELEGRRFIRHPHRHVCGAAYAVSDVAVSAGEPEKIERAKRIANEAATRLGLPERIDLPDLVTDQSFIGEGYGIPTEGGLEAIALVAQSEAILLDPCYTSKGMAALVQHVRSGELDAGDTVVFLHTGGMPALFTDGFVEALTRRPGY